MIDHQDRALVREVVASARIHGGTRVIVLTAREPQPHRFIVETVAYDSNHPGEFLPQECHPGPDLDALLAGVREHAARTFDPHPGIDGCDCWTRWDPDCGRPGCWGARADTYVGRHRKPDVVA